MRIPSLNVDQDGDYDQTPEVTVILPDKSPDKLPIELMEFLFRIPRQCVVRCKAQGHKTWHLKLKLPLGLLYATSTTWECLAVSRFCYVAEYLNWGPEQYLKYLLKEK